MFCSAGSLVYLRLEEALLQHCTLWLNVKPLGVQWMKGPVCYEKSLLQLETRPLGGRTLKKTLRSRWKQDLYQCLKIRLGPCLVVSLMKSGEPLFRKLEQVKQLTVQ